MSAATQPTVKPIIPPLEQSSGGKFFPYSLTAHEITSSFGVDPELGLSSVEIGKQRTRYGSNSIQTIRPRPAWRLLVDQFASIVIALLAVAALVAWATGDVIEAIAILVVLVINALVGFVTEWQAGRALDALRRKSRTTTRVRREGIETTVDAEELVPADIIILNAGDRVPADARLLESYGLQTEESALTGESTPVDKAIEPVAEDTPLSERHPMVYLGTSIAAGRALAVVVDTGAQTELGRVGRAHARTVALFAIIGAQLGHMFNCRSRTRSAVDGIFRNPSIWAATPIVVLLQLLAIYFSPLAIVLGTERLSEIDWMVIGICFVVPVIVVEISKAAVRWQLTAVGKRKAEAS